MVKAVLFDLDDTLFDHRHSSREALKALQSEFTRELGSIPLDALEIANLEILNSVHVEVLAGTLSPDDARTKRFGMLLTQYGIESVPDKLGSIAKHYRASYQLSRRAVPGAKRLLRLLRDRGLILPLSRII